MARSDSRPVSDDVLRAIAHELADAAPPAPDWDTFARGTDVEAAPHSPRRPGGRSRQLLLVAAVSLLVVGLWYFQPSDRPVPADVPSEPTSVPAETIPPVGFGTLDELDVHGCLTRRNARVVLDNRLLALEGSESLPGYTVDRARLAAYRPIVTALAGIVGHSDIDRTEADAISSVVDAYGAADAEAFAGPDGTEGPGFGALVDTFEVTLAAYLVASDDPPNCSTAPGPITADEARQAGQCVALWRLRHAVDAFAFSGDADDDRVIDTAAEALRRWTDPVVEEFTEVTDQVTELLASPVDERRVGDVLAPIDALLPSWSNQFCQPEVDTTASIPPSTDQSP